MRVFKILRRSLLLGLVFCFVIAQTAFAAPGGNEEKYTYTVTLYAGNQGTFNGTSDIIDNPSPSWSITQTSSDTIVISGLSYNDKLTINNNFNNSVSLADDSKYYVFGIRESGKDNNTADVSTKLLSLNVDSDREYVVAYAIKGNMVAYTVNYQNAAGAALADSQTFYGSVGTKPVVAFQYIDGYQPQAYNLTKTLSANEADNVFTFEYQTVSQEVITNTTTNTTTVNDGTTTTTTGGTTTGGTTGGGTATETTGGGTAGETTAGGETTAPETVTETDAQVPQGTVDLDDEETPTGSMDNAGDTERSSGNMPLFIGIAAVAVICLLGMAVFILKKRS